MVYGSDSRGQEITLYTCIYPAAAYLIIATVRSELRSYIVTRGRGRGHLRAAHTEALGGGVSPMSHGEFRNWSCLLSFLFFVAIPISILK